ncbi:MAG: winged helix-turn-helix domain-containing protein, partial [Blastocatellia bacterium]
MTAPDNRLYEFGPFVLDASSRILLKDGATVRLTPKALETLLVLVQRGMQVVDKEQLLKEVWPDSFVEEGSLSRNIHELRKALGDDSAEPRYIETIPKRGYRFVAPIKISAVETGQTDIAGLQGNATVIEKHTFARVVTDGFEGANLPDQTAPVSLVAGVKALAPAGVSERRKKQTTQKVLLLAALLVAGAIAAFVYLKLTRKSPAPVFRAKSTLVRLTNNNARDGVPVWSPDGSTIAFWSNRDGKNEIYVMDPDGSNVRRLTNNLADDDVPRWSPDSRKIVFDSERDGNKEIYVMDADGGNQTRLTRNDAIDSAATWSPDGSKIAFSSNRDNSYPFNFDIYVMNPDGSDVRRIVDDPEYDAEPKW